MTFKEQPWEEIQQRLPGTFICSCPDPERLRVWGAPEQCGLCGGLIPEGER